MVHTGARTHKVNHTTQFTHPRGCDCCCVDVRYFYQTTAAVRPSGLLGCAVLKEPIWCASQCSQLCPPHHQRATVMATATARAMSYRPHFRPGFRLGIRLRIRHLLRLRCPTPPQTLTPVRRGGNELLMRQGQQRHTHLPFLAMRRCTASRCTAADRAEQT